MSKPQLNYELPKALLDRWNPAIRAAEKDGYKDSNIINIYDGIGESWWDGTGMTTKIVSSILRQAGGDDILVNINSPGGDFFEGLAIHTLLSDYSGNVRIRVVGLAASAASVIALAGDEIEIAESGFLMIHNAWTCACGNKNDLQDVADMLDKFDQSMVGLYSKKTGKDEDEIRSMMDGETWINGKEAVDMGFANTLIGAGNVVEDDEAVSALRRMDIALAKAQMPRSERRKLIKEVTGTPSAAADPTPSAGVKAEKVLSDILNILKTSA